jgi:hypothetical protein
MYRRAVLRHIATNAGRRDKVLRQAQARLLSINEEKLMIKHLVAAVAGIGFAVFASSVFAQGDGGCARQVSAGLSDQGAPAQSASTNTSEKKS